MGECSFGNRYYVVSINLGLKIFPEDTKLDKTEKLHTFPQNIEFLNTSSFS